MALQQAKYGLAGGPFRRDVAQPGRALAWGARGRQFKSAHPDHFLSTLFFFALFGSPACAPRAASPVRCSRLGNAQAHRVAGPLPIEHIFTFSGANFPISQGHLSAKERAHASGHPILNRRDSLEKDRSPSWFGMWCACCCTGCAVLAVREWLVARQLKPRRRCGEIRERLQVVKEASSLLWGAQAGARRPKDSLGPSRISKD